MRYPTWFAAGLLPIVSAGVSAADIRAGFDRQADQVEPKVIEWRHDIHEHPELGSRAERRQAGSTHEPAVVTIDGIDGGNRFNIIPDKVEMGGTVRTFDEKMRDDIHRRIKLTADSIAAASGATATVTIEKSYAVSMTDPALTERKSPTLKRLAGGSNVVLRPKTTGAENFSFFAHPAPGLFIFLGGSPKGTDLTKVAYNHSPRFFVEDSAMKLGVCALLNLTVDYMESSRER